MPLYSVTLKRAGGTNPVYTTVRADNEWKARARVASKYPGGTISKVEKIRD